MRRRKLDRDRALLAEELHDRPDDPFVRFNLGAIAVELQDWAGALPHLQRGLDGSAPRASITAKLHALLARTLQNLDRPEEALEACRRGLVLEPDDAELLFRRGLLHRQGGDTDAAEVCWRRILELRPPERFCSVDTGIYGHLTRRNLALAAADRGDADGARRLWRAVLDECPGDAAAREALDRLDDLAP